MDEHPGKKQTKVRLDDIVNNWTLREKEREKVWQPTGEHSGRKQTQNKILWHHPADKHPVEGGGGGYGVMVIVHYIRDDCLCVVYLL